MRKFQIAVCTAQNFDGNEKEVEELLREFFKELEGFNKRIVFLYGGSLGGYMSLFGRISKEYGFERIAVIPIQFEPEQCNGKIYDKESDIVIKSTQSFGGRNEMLVRSGDVVLLINGGKFGSGSLVETILAYHNCKRILVLESSYGLAGMLREYIEKFGHEGYLDIRKKTRIEFFSKAEELAKRLKELCEEYEEKIKKI